MSGPIAAIGAGGRVDAAIAASQQNAGRAGHKSERVLIHVNDLRVTAVAAGRISPRGISILPKPDFEGVEKDAVRIVWIDRDTLVVPVLIIIGVAASAVGNRC